MGSSFLISFVCVHSSYLANNFYSIFFNYTNSFVKRLQKDFWMNIFPTEKCLINFPLNQKSLENALIMVKNTCSMMTDDCSKQTKQKTF